MKIIVSFTTFNNLKYTKLCLPSIKCSYPYEILVIDNGSIDGTIGWLKTQSVTLIANGENRGLPSAYNTMYDYAWKEDPENLLVVINNDNICLPNTIDELVKAANISNSNVISGDTITSPVYCSRYREDRRFLAGSDKITTNAVDKEVHGCRGWSPGQYYNLTESTAEEFVSTMCSKIILPKFEITPVGWYIPGHRLYKKPYFDSIGYWDVNYYPLYNLDIDYAIRAKLLNQSCVVVNSSFCFEFWSRALYESVVPVRDTRRMTYFRDKWGYNIVNWSGYSFYHLCPR